MTNLLWNRKFVCFYGLEATYDARLQKKGDAGLLKGKVSRRIRI